MSGPWFDTKDAMTMIELRYCEECACFVTDICRSGHPSLKVKIEPGRGFVIEKPKETTPKPPNDNPSHYDG